MLNNQIFYHGIIRNHIIAFGRLFSDIYIDRKENDSVDGTTIQRLRIPLSYAPKEKWLVRLDQDPNLENHTYVSLPRMSFEIIGYNYDPTRKLNRMQQIKHVVNGDSTTAFTPVPYNLDVSLYILTKNQEDGLQILEQVLPTFTPEYTLSINLVPDMGIVMDTPVVLNAVSVSDDYEGDFQTRRSVTHTLNFQMKLNLLGGLSNRSVIETVNTNVGFNEDFSSPNRTFIAEGDKTTTSIVTEDWLDNF